MITEKLTINRCESFVILEDKPHCETPIDKRIQEVIKPAMLVESGNGEIFLLFQQDETSQESSTHGETPLDYPPLREYPT